MAVYARRILTATAQLYYGYLFMEQAVIAREKITELGQYHYDYKFYLGKFMSARYYLNNAVPNVWHVADLIKIGDTSVLEASGRDLRLLKRKKVYFGLIKLANAGGCYNQSPASYYKSGHL